MSGFIAFEKFETRTSGEGTCKCGGHPKGKCYHNLFFASNNRI